MSIVEQAKSELALIGFGDDDTCVMAEILEKFFGQWDSGGAVHAVAPILMRCIAGKPLSPLTGADDEWTEVGDGIFQNKRCSSVFKDPRFHDGKLAYDIDAPEPRAAITFPYWTDNEIEWLRNELDYAYRCVSSGYNQGVFDFSILKDRALAHVKNARTRRQTIAADNSS